MLKFQGSTKKEESSTSEKNTNKLSAQAMEEISKNIWKILPKSSSELDLKIFHSLESCSCTVNNSIGFLLKQCTDLLFRNMYSHCASSSEPVLDFAWEKLNSFHWKDVPVMWQKIYSFACMFKAASQAQSATTDADLVEICRVADMGLLMGFDIMDGILHQIIDICKPCTERNVPLRCKNRESKAQLPVIKSPLLTVSNPSLTLFSEKMKAGTPFILENCTDHWPAANLWSFDYLNKIAGHRLVPVELGSKYTDESWGQNLMTISNFINNFIFNEDPTKPKAYLAQHRLFDQIPLLKDDIYIPDYCSISDLENCNPEINTEINAWFGPSGTVSPCHYDLKHNLLAQVVGRKYVCLYNPSCKSALYPHQGLLSNTSTVDIENPDYERFPLFQEMDKNRREECILLPGQMLYIPPGYFHYIRSLDESFSVSFWWD